MTVHEPSKTPTPGMFIRNRTNAISVRSRRSRKVLDQNENEINSEEVSKNSGKSGGHAGSRDDGGGGGRASQIRPRSRSRFSSEFDQSVSQSKSEEILMPSDYHRRERAYSNDWEKRRKNSCEENLNNLDAEDDDLDENILARPVSRRDFERKSEVFSSRSTRSRSRAGYQSNGPMETLDRRISASTDNLDTLKREKRSNRMWNEHTVNSQQMPQRPRSVSSRKPDKNAKQARSVEKPSAVDDDITFRINGEKMSKNRYFFGGELKSALKSTSKSNKNNNNESNNQTKPSKQSSNSEHSSSKGGGSETKASEHAAKAKKSAKTALDIFLEDKGPYSRKLYGPPPSGGSGQDPHQEPSGPSSKNNNRKRARSQEALQQLHGNFGEVSSSKCQENLAIIDS